MKTTANRLFIDALRKSTCLFPYKPHLCFVPDSVLEKDKKTDSPWVCARMCLCGSWIGWGTWRHKCSSLGKVTLCLERLFRSAR